MRRKNSGQRRVHLVSADGMPLCGVDVMGASTSDDPECEGIVCQKCQRVMEKELATLASLRALRHLDVGNVDSPEKWAKVTFCVVPHGWQCDVEIHHDSNKKLQVKGSVCRDWGDSDRSARRFVAKLVQMGQTGQP